jgi:hypothetical protein
MLPRTYNRAAKKDKIFLSQRIFVDALKQFFNTDSLPA